MKVNTNYEMYPTPFILCAIDGNTNIFNQSLWVEGYNGGRLAADQLTKGIAEYLSHEAIHVFGRLSFWITIFVDREHLLATLIGSNICTTEQFNAFFTGFAEAQPRFLVVDAGNGQSFVDAKLKGKSHSRPWFQFYIKRPFPSVQSILRPTQDSLRLSGSFSVV